MTMKAPKTGETHRGTCRECGRTIEFLRLEDGALLKLDTEVRTVVAWPKGKTQIPARMLHASVCRPKAVKP